jgi:signal transduction histidine kinase
MRALAGCTIALANAADEGSISARLGELERAGASVRCCNVGQDLWSSLSEGGLDLIIVLAERENAAALALLDQIRLDPRTGTVPTLLVAPSGTKASALTLTAAATEPAFVRSAAELAIPTRRLREGSIVERALRDQLARELNRAEQRELARAEANHELRSIANAGLGFACNLRDELAGPLSSDQRDHVAGILEALERMAQMLEKHSIRPTPSHPIRIVPTSQPPRAQRTLVSLGRCAADVCALFEALAARKQMRLQLVCDDSVAVWGDALRLKQVITNLVVNAIKYCPNGAAIRLDVTWTDAPGSLSLHGRRAAEIAVTDNGPGIAADQHERIFNRGYRIDPHDQVPGEGIGLAVVKDIVGQHGGSIRVEGELGRGTIFRVWLPQDRRHRARNPEGLSE